MGTKKVNKDKEEYDIDKQMLGRKDLDERLGDKPINEMDKDRRQRKQDDNK